MTIVIIAILREGATAARMCRLAELTRLDCRTIEQWRGWWREVFTAIPFWQIARAAFMPSVDEEKLPAAMLERFTGDAAERMLALLRFLGPITGGQVQDL